MYKLLTPEEKTKLEKEYRIRLATVGASLVSSLALFAILAFMPTLILTTSQRESALLNLALAERSSKIDSAALKAWAVTTRQKLSALNPEKNPDLPYDWYMKILAQKPSGISIINLTYQKPGNKPTIRLRGVAKDRQRLLLFQGNLNKSKDFADLTFPVDTLAKDTDINFDFTLYPPAS